MNLTFRRSGSLSLILLLAVVTNPSQAGLIIDFEDPLLPPATALPATAVDQTPYVSQGVSFKRGWNTEYDCCPSGWAVSNQTDQVTPGPESAHSAVARSSGGGGANSRQFAVANNFQRGEARVDFPQSVEVQGAYLTNVTYTFLATVEGRDGAGFVKGPFAAGDWLRLDVIGLDEQQAETGRLSIYLLDYRDGQAVTLDEWNWFDLTSLGTHVSALEFEMSSTDAGPFGMNTPAFFAIDDLSFRLVPEPSSLFPMLTGLAIALRFRRRKSCGPPRS